MLEVRGVFQHISSTKSNRSTVPSMKPSNSGNLRQRRPSKSEIAPPDVGLQTVSADEAIASFVRAM